MASRRGQSRAGRMVVERTLRQNEKLRDTILKLKSRLLALEDRKSRSNREHDIKLEALKKENVRLRKSNQDLQKQVQRLKKMGSSCRNQLRFVRDKTMDQKKFNDLMRELDNEDEKMAYSLQCLSSTLACEGECPICFDSIVDGHMSCCLKQICLKCEEQMVVCPYCRDANGDFIGV